MKNELANTNMLLKRSISAKRCSGNKPEAFSFSVSFHLSFVFLFSLCLLFLFSLLSSFAFGSLPKVSIPSFYFLIWATKAYVCYLSSSLISLLITFPFSLSISALSFFLSITDLTLSIFCLNDAYWEPHFFIARARASSSSLMRLAVNTFLVSRSSMRFMKSALLIVFMILMTSTELGVEVTSCSWHWRVLTVSFKSTMKSLFLICSCNY